MLLMRKSAGACSLLVERISVKYFAKPVCRSLPEQKKLDQRFKNFELYELKRCPDCSRLRRQLHKDQINIQANNAEKYQCYRNEILKGGGTVQFPCLKIRQADGSQIWLYGYEDIYNRLQQELLVAA